MISARNSRITFISITPSQTGLRSMGPFQRSGEAAWRKKSIEPTLMPRGPTGGMAPAGVMASVWPCIPSMRGTQGPLRSTSSTPTLCPRRASASPRFTVVMLFPTPPFPLMTTSLCLMPAMRSWTCRVCSAICWTTFASSVYWSLLRIAFKSFSAIFREALNVQSQDPYSLRKQHRNIAVSGESNQPVALLAISHQLSALILDGVLERRFRANRMRQDAFALEFFKDPAGRRIKILGAGEVQIGAGRRFLFGLAHVHGNDGRRMHERPDRLNHLVMGKPERIGGGDHDQPGVDQQAGHLPVAADHLGRVRLLGRRKIGVEAAPEVFRIQEIGVAPLGAEKGLQLPSGKGFPGVRASG